MPANLDFLLLGPLEARLDGEQLALGGARARQRAVLGCLLVHAGEAVTTDRLIDALWGEQPPPSARTLLQGHIVQLRRLLEPGRGKGEPAHVLVTLPDGYQLCVEDEALDRARFERALAEGREALVAGRVEQAAGVLRGALELWRGSAFGDLAYEPWARAEAERLDELRLACLEERVEADLQLGRHAELVGELHSLVAAEPLRERPRGQLMRALYAAGRQAEALEAYQEARRLFVDELGLDPSPALRELEAAILRQDASLDAPPRAGAEWPRTPSNLPRASSTLVGRQEELAELRALLASPAVRLISLTGPGGTGKTRLALALADAAASDGAPAGFPDGVFWVPLATLRDPALALGAIAEALALKPGSRPLIDTLADALAGRRLLIVLDNTEQLLPELATDLAQLLRIDGPTVLVTSRERIRLTDEHVYPVPSLSSEHATEFFLARSKQHGALVSHDATVDELCARLDRLPLALELAAARTTLLSPEQLLERLSQRLDLLQGGRDTDPRQQTLRTTISWSYDLLSEEERTLFARLAVFVGGCTLEAAEQVCEAGLDTLASLLDKSLARRRDDRFWMLETIREFALECLAGRDELGMVALRHAEWQLAFAERAFEFLGGAEQARWLRLLENDHDNLRAALTWAYEADQLELALRLTAALHPFWYRHGHIAEGRRWLERAVAASVGQQSALRLSVLGGANAYAGVQDDWARARELAEEGLALSRVLGDRRGTAILLRDVGSAAVRAGDYETARSSYEESAALLDELGERRLLSTAIANLGDLAFRQGDFARAAELTRQTLAVQREVGAVFGAAISLITLGFIAVAEGRGEEARVPLEEGMLLTQELGSVDNLGYAFEGLGAVAAARKDWDRAARLLGRAEAIREETATELETAEQAVHDQTLEALQAAPPDAGIAAGHAAGRLLSNEAAIALALEPAGARA